MPNDPIIKKAELKDDSIVCWAPDYSHLDKLDRADKKRQRVVAGLLDCQRAAAASEYVGIPDLTGRYAGAKSAACINQAGYAMVIWWSYTDEDSTWHYEAEFVTETGLFVVRQRAAPYKAVADLSIDLSGPEPTIEFLWHPGEAGPDEVLVRYSDRATLSDRAVAAIEANLPGDHHPMVEGALREEHAPLGPLRTREFREALVSKEMRRALEEVFATEDDHGIGSDKINTALKALAIRLQHAFLPRATSRMEVGDVHAEDDRFWSKVRYELQEFLHATNVTLAIGPDRSAQTQTLYRWFQNVIYYNEYAATAPNVRVNVFLHKCLGVGAQQRHAYALAVELSVVTAEVTLPLGKRIAKVIGKYKHKLPGDAAKRLGKWVEKKLESQAGGRVMLGTLDIASRGRAKNWEATYAVAFFVAGAGAGGGGVEKKKYRANGTTHTGLAWSSADFAGPVTVLSGQGARDKNGKLASNQMIWIAEGSNPSERSTQLLFHRDIETDLDAQAAGIGWGEIFDPHHVGEDPPTPTVRKILNYSTEYVTPTDVHFRLGSATLREEARRLVRRLAAHELVALRDPGTKVSFTGFADRLGGEGYNDVLSRSRAENTKTALLDCTGSSVVARLEVEAVGERLLKFLHRYFGFHPDEEASPNWRRVFVMVHGVACIELVVRDLKGSG